ncbi:tetratricopeptide repeat protein [Pseudanabaena sp. PCC 6802]|uniref:tetratricopeptide repeat protein n=1 Tax=Pseudanabaena sp. PCC 6802 TaxID=118173 RepID=UPI000349FCE3|nr:tetratricopeptide repeat protein [Pseudanabaena sp. PCC 6802]
MIPEIEFRSEEDLGIIDSLQNKLEEAIFHQHEGFFRQAKRLYKEVLAQDPKHAEALHRLGSIECELGRFEVGVNLINSALELNPNIVEAHISKGKCLSRQGRLSEAIAAFERAIEIDPNLADAYQHLSIALKDSGNLEAANFYKLKALTLAPSLPNPPSNLSSNLSFGLDESFKSLPEEIELIQQKLEEAHAHHSEGFTNQAKNLYEEVLTLQADNFDALYMLGTLAYESGKIADGLDLLKKAMLAQPENAEVCCQIGNGFYKLGNLDDAIARYRQAVNLNSNYTRAYYNLGIALHKTGDLEGAVDSLEKAIALRGDDPKLLYHLGAVLQQQGKFQAALGRYQKALELKPNFVRASRALVNLVASIQEFANVPSPQTPSDSGRLDREDREPTKPERSDADQKPENIEAIDRDRKLEQLKQLLRAEPKSAELYGQIGDIQHQLGNFEAAIAAYQKATEIDPKSVEAHFELASIFLKLNQPQAVIHYCQQIIAIDPLHAEAHWMYGVALTQVNSLDAAISHLHQAIAFKPDYADAFSSLGAIYVLQGKLDEAIAYLQRGRVFAPNAVDLLYNLAGALKQKEKWYEALEYYQQIIKIQPNYALAYQKCGEILVEDNQIEEAIAYFQKLLSYQDDNPIANRLSRLALPVLYDNEEEIGYWRYRYEEGLQKYIDACDLSTEKSQKLALAGISYCTNFYLTYQAKNDLELQRQYAEFVQRVMAANYPQWTQKIEMPPLGKDEKIRIGYISPNLKGHAGVAWSLGWLRQRDRSKFEVYSYFTGRFPDETTALFQAESDRFRHIPDSFEAICEQVRQDNLHILVFPDIGMDAQSLKLAVLRLAPIQCACWGHPITSGSPNIEYFLSGDLMEPENAQSHYSEILVRLPKLGFCYPKPQLPRDRKTRKDFNIPEDAIVYLACQSLYKYLPQHDRIFVEIAQRVPNAKFVFLCRTTAHVHDQFYRRLQKAFAAAELDVARFCIMLPKQTGDDYLSVHLASDIFLDSIGWSGGNTSLEAIACGLPIVTLPGEFMRGRHTYAMLKILAMEDTIAQNESEYISIAVRLAQDPDWRRDVVERMRSRHGDLYEDTTCVRALEDFYMAITSSQKSEEILSEGISHQQAGRLEEARQLYRKILWQQPHDFNALYLSGTIAYRLGNNRDAIRYLRQTIFLRGDHAEAHKKLGDIFLEQGEPEEAIAAYQNAVTYKPEYFDAHFNLANLLWQTGDGDRAVFHYQQVIERNPNFVLAYSNLGAILYDRGKVEEATDCLRRALEIDPDLAEANYNLGTMLFKQGKSDAALPYLEKAIAQNPQSAEAHNVLGNSLREQGKLHDAIDRYREAIALSPDYAEAHRNLGTALLTQGNFEQGLAEYEWRWQMPIFQQDPVSSLIQPLWDGSDLAGKSILIHSEQGYGDTIQFIRYLSLLRERNARLVVACPTPLIRLLSHMEGIAAIGDRYEQLPATDWRIPLMSLPRLFGTTLESIPKRVPYISAPNAPDLEFRAPHHNIHVGLVWASKPGHLTANKRSCPFSLLSLVLSIPGIYFYSLQKDVPSSERHLLDAHHDRITDLGHQIGDFADTASLISKMDLIITVDTAVAHLAGAMGKPVWVLLPYASDWRWLLDRDDSPWYPTMRLFRQKQIGNWEGVITRVAMDLRKWIN